MFAFYVYVHAGSVNVDEVSEKYELLAVYTKVILNI
jgi:hypothetical protein